MYDNVQESMDCPTDEVIEDDDMLDGWFIIQRKKQETERAKSELEKRTQNSKISNSDEIYVFTDSRKEAESIDNMNSINAQMIKKQREQTIESKGGAVDLDFQDQKIKLSNMSNEQFKGKFRR
jgi:microcompartment protein CcmL/EutN